MAVIRTVGGLRKALGNLDPSLPVRVLDKGSATRGFQLFQVTVVEEGTVGSDPQNRPVALVDVKPSRS